MGMAGADAWAAFTAERLLAASLQGGVVIALVWLACRRPWLSPRVQAALWWIASLKLIVSLVPVAAVPVPLLPADTLAFEADSRPEPLRPELPAGLAPSGLDADAALPPPPVLAPGGAPRTNTWLVALAGLWLVGVAAGIARLIASLRRLRGLVQRSAPVAPDVTEQAKSVASSLGLRHVPEVRVSPEVETPQVAGLWRPVVVLPAAISTWSAVERRMTMAHELVHVQRRDLVLGWMPALAERLFFFHPLAHLAAREYAVAREAACDAAVLHSLDVEPAAYGRLLLRLGIARVEPAIGVAGSSASASGLKRRLEMLHHVSRTTPRGHRRWITVAAAALTMLPFQLVARTEPAPGSGRESSVESAVVQQEAGRAVSPADGRWEGDRLVIERGEQSLAPLRVDGETFVVRWNEQSAANAPQEPARTEAPPEPDVERAWEALGRLEQVESEALRARMLEMQALVRRAAQDDERAQADSSAGDLARRLEGLAAAQSRFVELEQSRYEELRKKYEAELAQVQGAAGAKLAAASRQAQVRLLGQQLEALNQQFDAVKPHHEALLRQQETLIESQRLLSEQLQLLRQALDRVARDARAPRPVEREAPAPR